MKFKVVEIREVYISRRVVLVEDDETEENIRENAGQGWELGAEYDFTMDPDETWTIQDATAEEIEKAKQGWELDLE